MNKKNANSDHDSKHDANRKGSSTKLVFTAVTERTVSL